MKPVSIINNDLDDRLHIGFIVGTTCNYKCHYCFESCNDGKYRWPTDLNLITKNLQHLIEIYKIKFNKNSIRLHITGGEPTLWPELGEFAKYFKKIVGCKITISTNGTRTLRFWEQYAEFFDDIAISIHNERCDVNHLIEIMDYIYLHHPDVLINGTVLMDPLNWSRSEEIASKLTAHLTPWLLKTRPVLTQGKMDLFDETQINYMADKIKKMPPKERIDRYKELEIIQKDEPNVIAILEDGTSVKYNTFNFLENNWHHFKGWKCNLGIDRIGIERNGDVQGICGARNLFGLNQPINIYDSKFTEKFTTNIIQPTICPQQSCLCATDIRMTKHVSV